MRYLIGLLLYIGVPLAMLYLLAKLAISIFAG